MHEHMTLDCQYRSTCSKKKK